MFKKINLFLLIFIIFFKIYGQKLIFTDNNTPLKGVKVSLLLYKGKDKVNLQSDYRGEVLLKKLKQGLWKVRVYKEGFYPDEFFLFLNKKNTWTRKYQLTESSNNPPEFLRACEYFFKWKDKKAAKIFVKYKDPDSLKLAALSYYYSKEYEKAEKLLSESKKERNRVLLADIYLRANDYRKAVKVLKKLKPESVYNPEILKNIGKFFYEREEYEKAIPFLKRSINLSPKEGKTYYFLGLSYAATNKRDDAIKNLKKFMKLEPDSVDVVIADSVIRTLSEMKKEGKK